MTAEMTEIERAPRRARRARRAAASVLALTLLAAGAAACAKESDESTIQMEPVEDEPDGGGDSGPSTGPANFEATTEFLKDSATRSEAASHRVEMRFAVGSEVPDDAPPLMQGEVDGDQFHYNMDLAPIMDGVLAQMGDTGGVDVSGMFADMDLTMEMIGTGDTWYLRAPMFAELGSLAGGSVPGMEELTALGDGWGSIDVQQLGDVLPGDLSSSVLGQGGVDPSAVIEMVTNAEGVEDAGTDTIRDTPVHGLRAEVTLADMMEASGQDPDALAAAGGVGDSEDMMQALIDTPMPVEVWIDDNGYLVRMTYGFSMGDVFEAMGQGDLLDSTGMGDLDFAYSVDMFDYGESFTFEAPADATDITDAFAEIYQA